VNYHIDVKPWSIWMKDMTGACVCDV